MMRKSIGWALVVLAFSPLAAQAAVLNVTSDWFTAQLTERACTYDFSGPAPVATAGRDVADAFGGSMLYTGSFRRLTPAGNAGINALVRNASFEIGAFGSSCGPNNNFPDRTWCLDFGTASLSWTMTFRVDGAGVRYSNPRETLVFWAASLNGPSGAVQSGDFLQDGGIYTLRVDVAGRACGTPFCGSVATVQVDFGNASVARVPEPATAGLFAAMLGAVAATRRRRSAGRAYAAG